MYEDYQSATTTKRDGRYLLLLSFYPKQYKRRFGEEMFLAFQDLYQEELETNGRVGAGFWLSIFTDTVKSGLREHFMLMKNQGIKKYLHINSFNILGIILLLPFLALFATDFLGRLVQGDFVHYNRVWNSALSQSFLYKDYIGKLSLLWFLLILAPILAVILNLLPIVGVLVRNKRKLTLKSLFLANPVAVIILGIGLFCLMIVYGHDFFPCTIHGIIYHGLGSIGKAISVCRNA